MGVAGISWLAFFPSFSFLVGTSLFSGISLGTGTLKKNTAILSHENNIIDGNTEKDGFSACLIFKDDNDRLVEWIAYHYQVLPLRFLVVGVDYHLLIFCIDGIKQEEYKRTFGIQVMLLHPIKFTIIIVDKTISTLLVFMK